MTENTTIETAIEEEWKERFSDKRNLGSDKDYARNVALRCKPRFELELIEEIKKRIEKKKPEIKDIGIEYGIGYEYGLDWILEFLELKKTELKL